MENVAKSVKGNKTKILRDNAELAGREIFRASVETIHHKPKSKMIWLRHSPKFLIEFAKPWVVGSNPARDAILKERFYDS